MTRGCPNVNIFMGKIDVLRLQESRLDEDRTLHKPSVSDPFSRNRGYLQNSFWTNLFISLFGGRITSFFGEKIDCSIEEAMAVLLSRDALHVNDSLLYSIDAAFDN